VLQPERARDPAFMDVIRKLAPELNAVVAYGQILTARYWICRAGVR
jgi:methionyl-tRNA formyltransferase